MTTTAAKVLEDKRLVAEERHRAERDGKMRVAVQVGHCSRSVGAEEVAQALAAVLPDGAYLVTAGCDGACFAAPQIVATHPSGTKSRFVHVRPGDAQDIAAQIASGRGEGDSPVNDFFAGQRRVALYLSGELASAEIDDYLLSGGYGALARSLSMDPADVTREVKASGLRGRGGAYFPPAAKWESVRQIEKTPKYLVVNSEEGEPGVYKDRHIMEGMPHRLVEGTIIAAYASGVHEAFIYINAEADLSADRVERAVDQAYANGLLGEDILGSGFDLGIEIRRGAGGYVCGEETTLLDTMEGRRREPRLRPPFPTEAGLRARPTVVNNAETLANVPFILDKGAQAFAEIGTGDDNGTKIISLSGSVRRPGVVEVPMGTTLRQIVYDIGGGTPQGRTLEALAVGGPSSGLLPPSRLDTPIRPGMLHESGVMLGAGGVIAVDDRAKLGQTVRKLAEYNASESCGKCAPCREGTPRIVEALDRVMSPGGTTADLDELNYLANVVGKASLCGLGQAAGNPIKSSLHFFGNELAGKSGTQDGPHPNPPPMGEGSQTGREGVQ